jgi:serine phosphatase RsbU (regulator of sigma subunit)/anti-sigma regulatory factor (Ser/Thr protein kinase)
MSTRGSPSPIEGVAGRGPAAFRRRMIGGVGVAVLLLAGVSVVLAWRQYDSAKSRALTDLRARVVAGGMVLDAYFAGDVSTLSTAAAAPDVVAGKTAPMTTYLARAFPKRRVFTGGVGWVDRAGTLRASSIDSSASGLDLSGRAYVSRVLATRKPYVSGGLIGLRGHREILVVAVPTFDARGRISGVLAGSIVLKATPEDTRGVSLGFGDLAVIDRDGRLLASGLGRVANRPLLATMRKQGEGVASGTHGLDGRRDDVVAFASVKLPHWLILIDRPRATVFAAARRALYLELASVGAAVLLVLVLTGFVLWRARRDGAAQAARAQSWNRLTQALGAASTPPEVAGALLSTLADAFPGGVAVVALVAGDDLRVRAASRLPRLERVVGGRALLDAVVDRCAAGKGTWVLEDEPELRPIQSMSARRLKALHGLPLRDRRGEPLGAIALLTSSTTLEAGEWALLESFAEQAVQALDRAWRFAHEHDLAVHLQRSLLPGELPQIDGMELNARYLAGAAAVEVGGDWYDAVRRPDGILQLCVGDVSGRGVAAATVMGTQRNTFRAYAYECVSPAEIVRRMLRHVEGESAMITVACVSIDPYTAELTYARAGHPPPLLVDRDTRAVTRLSGAGSPPLGLTERAEFVEETLQLPDRITLAMYTDGLLERRGENIDVAIERFGELVAAEPGLEPGGLVERVGELFGEPDDDVALLVVSLDVQSTRFQVELPAAPRSLSALRRRLGGWLMRREVDPEEAAEIVLAVSEACNNAVEHAYPGDRRGTVTVTADTRRGGLEVTVEDEGTWRDGPPSADRGRGLVLIRTLMDSAEVVTNHQGTRVILRRQLRAARAANGEAIPAPAPL